MYKRRHPWRALIDTSAVPASVFDATEMSKIFSAEREMLKCTATASSSCARRSQHAIEDALQACGTSTHHVATSRQFRSACAKSAKEKLHECVDDRNVANQFLPCERALDRPTSAFTSDAIASCNAREPAVVMFEPGLAASAHRRHAEENSADSQKRLTHRRHRRQ